MQKQSSINPAPLRKKSKNPAQNRGKRWWGGWDLNPRSLVPETSISYDQPLIWPS